jgi:hypothetical protein
VAVARPMPLYLHRKGIEPEEIHDKSRVSYDAEVTANIVVDQFEDFEHTEVSTGKQLAFADEGYNLAGHHSKLYYSSYPT